MLIPYHVISTNCRNLYLNYHLDEETGQGVYRLTYFNDLYAVVTLCHLPYFEPLEHSDTMIARLGKVDFNTLEYIHTDLPETVSEFYQWLYSWAVECAEEYLYEMRSAS